MGMPRGYGGCLAEKRCVICFVGKMGRGGDWSGVEFGGRWRGEGRACVTVGEFGP